MLSGAGGWTAKHGKGQTDNTGHVRYGIIATMSEHWISAQEARTHVNRTERQLRRYAESGQIQSRRRGKNVEYLQADIERLAQELPQEAPELPADLQLIPAGDLVEYIRDLHGQLEDSAAREGYLRAQLESVPQLEDTHALQTELVRINTERDTLQHQSSSLQVRYHRTRLLTAALLVVLVAVLALLVVAVLSGWTVTLTIG